VARILFPSSTSPGIKPAEGGGRLLNCYAERLGEGAPAQYVIRRAPGLLSFSDTAQTTFRGSFFDAGNIFSAWSGFLRKTNSAGVSSAVGALAGTDPVFFARNNKTPTPDYVAVCAAGPFTFTTAAVTALVDPDLPLPVSVCFLEGYFFFAIGDGRCFASGLNAITVNALDVARVESKPLGLIRGIAFNGELYLWGPKNCEVWGSGGDPNPTGFPFRRTTTIGSGLINATAIAGWEDGFPETLIWVADDNTVRQLNGYTPTKISTPELDRLLDGVSDKTTISCAVYVVAGHPVVNVRSPTFSWSYDISTQKWFERESYLSPTWRLLGNTVNAFGKWYGGDAESGRLMEITENVYREHDQPLIWQADSIAMEAFPTRLQVPRADFNFVAGTGVADSLEPEVVDPMVDISYSDDGGNTWSIPQSRPLGQAGAYASQITVTRLGMTGAKGRRWRLSVSASVYVGLLGGDMQAVARAA
jgi:hypothetical protein